MPPEPPAPVPNAMLGDIYNPEKESWHLPLWPRFLPLRPVLSEAVVERGKLKAPGTWYDPFTRVEGDTEHGFPSVPPLEPSLVAILLLKATFFRRKPMPPSQHDQVTARFTDQAHQCAAQMAVAINDISLLTSSITTQPSALPDELVTENGKATAAILTLSPAAAVAQACMKAWMMMLQRSIWLHVPVA